MNLLADLWETLRRSWNEPVRITWGGLFTIAAVLAMRPWDWVGEWFWPLFLPLMAIGLVIAYIWDRRHGWM